MNGNQCALLRGTSSISQSVYLNPGNYDLIFMLGGFANTVTGIYPSPFNITLNGTQIYSNALLTGSNYQWQPIYVSFQIATAANYAFSFNTTGPSTSFNMTGLENVRIIPTALTNDSWLHLYRDAATTSLKLSYYNRGITRIDTKLLDYSANAIYNTFINVNKYNSNTFSVKAYTYDESHNLVGNTLNWVDASFNTAFTEMYVGRPRDFSNNTIFKGKMYNVNMYVPTESSYYGFSPTGGTDFVSTTDVESTANYYTLNGSGTNTTYLSVLPTNTALVSQTTGLREATT